MDQWGILSTLLLYAPDNNPQLVTIPVCECHRCQTICHHSGSVIKSYGFNLWLLNLPLCSLSLNPGPDLWILNPGEENEIVSPLLHKIDFCVVWGQLPYAWQGFFKISTKHCYLGSSTHCHMHYFSLFLVFFSLNKFQHVNVVLRL